MTRRLLSPALVLVLAASGQAAVAAPAPTAFTVGRLVSAISRDLSEHYRIEGDLQLELLRAWTPPAQTAANWEVVVEEYPPLPMSTLYIRFRLFADGVQADETNLLLRAAVWQDAWFCRQPVAAGSIFNPASLETRPVDSLRVRDALPATSGDSSFMFARDVSAGRMITWHDVARRPLVRKGEVVDVIASEGQLVVTMKAMALENGGPGDLVTVRNLETLKDISGLVVSDDRVQVRF